MTRFAQFRINRFEKLLAWLDRRAARRNREAPHLTTGRRGELAAMFHLRRQGFVIAARDWRTSRARGDLDLVAWEGGVLCFVEVKTRTSRDVATAESAVDANKKRLLRRMAHHYLRQTSHGDIPVRFDILSVYFEQDHPPHFDLFRGAFGWE